MRLLRPIDESRVRVRYRAGLADDPSGLPEAIRAGIIRLAAHLYAHRDGMPGAVPPAAVTALMAAVAPAAAQLGAGYSRS